MTEPRHSQSVNVDAIAAQWIARRDRGFSPRETKEFTDWLAQPAHAEAFARCEATWQALPLLKKLSGENLASLMIPRRRRWAPVVWLSTAAGAAAAAAVIVLFLVRPHPEGNPDAQSLVQSYQAPAEIEARVALPDGSIAILQRGTQITFQNASSGRQVRLLTGEAHFTVAKTTPNPFSVRAGPVVVRDIGTAFDVKLQSDQVAVLVTEGRVMVSRETLSGTPSHDQSQTLTLGQKAVVDTAQTTPQVTVKVRTPKEMEQELAWKSRQLSFDRTPLSEAVAELNHYNVRQLIIADPEVAPMLIAGGVRSDNLDAFVRLLDSGFGVTAEFRDQQILLRKAR